MTIPELFESLKAYINSVIGDKITIINGKTTDASNSASAAADSAEEAAGHASDASTSADNAADAATAAVTTAVNELKGGAPAAFDTLGEIADELAANQTLHASMLNQVGDAATKAQWANVTGKPAVFPTNVANVSDLPTIDRLAPTGNTLVQRTAEGNLYTNTGSNSGHAANKGYVDAQIGTRAPSTHNHTIAQVPGLQAALDGKQPKSQTLTQSQYDALATKDPAVTYNIVAG